MEIKGKIHLIEDEQQITDTFKKRTFILFVLNERNEEYSDYIPFELKQDKTDLIAPYKVGDTINVHYNLKGRKWTKDGVDRYFGSNECWRIEKISQEQSAPAPSFEESDIPPSGPDEDLPF